MDRHGFAGAVIVGMIVRMVVVVIVIVIVFQVGRAWTAAGITHCLTSFNEYGYSPIAKRMAIGGG
jgi:hypothetical protein